MTTGDEARIPPDVVGHAGALAAVVAAAYPELVGVYLHGSAVLGGFQPARSDVDVLAVVGRSATVDTQRAVGEAIAATARKCPGTGLEMSVVTAATAGRLGTCAFEVHVNTTGPEAVVVTGADHPGDPDLVLHCAVCRDHALAVTGPPPGRVFGPVPRDRVLGAMAADLRWAIGRGRIGYAVLNACRALRYAECGLLCGKWDGAEWYLAHHPGDPVVLAALAHTRHAGTAPGAVAAAGFLEQTLRRLSPDGTK